VDPGDDSPLKKGNQRGTIIQFRLGTSRIKARQLVMPSRGGGDGGRTVLEKSNERRYTQNLGMLPKRETSATFWRNTAKIGVVQKRTTIDVLKKKKGSAPGRKAERGNVRQIQKKIISTPSPGRSKMKNEKLPKNQETAI